MREEEAEKGGGGAVGRRKYGKVETMLYPPFTMKMFAFGQ